MGFAYLKSRNPRAVTAARRTSSLTSDTWTQSMISSSAQSNSIIQSRYNPNSNQIAYNHWQSLWIPNEKWVHFSEEEFVILEKKTRSLRVSRPTDEKISALYIKDCKSILIASSFLCPINSYRSKDTADAIYRRLRPIEKGLRPITCWFYSLVPTHQFNFWVLMQLTATCSSLRTAWLFPVPQ